jgi:hypothetical protein
LLNSELVKCSALYSIWSIPMRRGNADTIAL